MKWNEEAEAACTPRALGVLASRPAPQHQEGLCSLPPLPVSTEVASSSRVPQRGADMTQQFLVLKAQREVMGQQAEMAMLHPSCLDLSGLPGLFLEG